MLDFAASDLSSSPERLLAQFKQYDFSNLTQDQLRAVRSTVFGIPSQAHMIAICLRQIDEFANQLRRYPLWSGELATKGKSFRSIIRSSKNRELRNFLEHSAEYIAGKGRNQQLVVDRNEDWPGILVIDGKVERITIFGLTYDTKPAILAAIELVKALPSSPRAAGIL